MKGIAMTRRCNDTAKAETTQGARQPQSAASEARLAAVVEAAYILEARTR
jgi:hypothetical protein